MSVLLAKFRELKECKPNGNATIFKNGVIFNRLRQIEFQEENLKTLEKADKFENYTVLLQNYHNDDRDTYMDILREQQKVMKGEPQNNQQKDISLRLKHLYLSQPKEFAQ